MTEKIMFWVPTDMKDHLRKISYESRESMSNLIRTAIMAYLIKHGSGV